MIKNMKPIKSMTILLLLLALIIAPACDTLDEIDLGNEPAPVYVEPVYTDNTDGTISDTSTNGIMWTKCAKGQTGPTCNGGALSKESYSEAKTYCDDLTLGTYSDWRLPTIGELKTLTYSSSLYNWYYDYITPLWWWSSSFENSVFVFRLYIPGDMQDKSDSTSTAKAWYVRCARAIQP